MAPSKKNARSGADAIIDMIPRYQRLRLELDAYLAHLPIGAKIMTEHQLADKFSVSRVTARKALEQLRQDGTLISVPGRGTFLEKTVVHSRNGAAKSQFIALLVPSGQTTKIGEIIEGAEKTAAQRGYQMVISHDHDDPKLQIAQLRKLALTQVAGIMLFPDRFVSERAEFLALLEDLKRRNLPVVLLDRYLPNLDLPCVMTDNVQGMYELTEHLICCGRRRLALLGFWASNTVHMARRKGFIEALRDHKLPSHPVKEGNIPGAKDFFRAAHDVVAGWVAGKTAAELPFDAIVCMFDLLAYGAYTALQAVGLRVPEDVALVGYDNLDSEMYRTMGLELTSVQQPLAAEGSAAAELLIDLVEGKSNGRRSSHVLLPPKLVVRTSCGSALQ